MAPSEESQHREEDRRMACFTLRRHEGLKLLKVYLVYSLFEQDERFTVRLVKTHQDRLANYFNKTITSPADVKHITLYSSAVILEMDQSTRFHTKHFKASCSC